MHTDMRLRRRVRTNEGATNRSIHRVNSARNCWCMGGYTTSETLRGGGDPQAIGAHRGCFAVQALPDSQNYS